MTKQFENMIHTIDSLTEEEVKALLKLVYARMDIVENGNGYSSEQCVSDTLNMFKEIPRIKHT